MEEMKNAIIAMVSGISDSSTLELIYRFLIRILLR